MLMAAFINNVVLWPSSPRRVHLNPTFPPALQLQLPVRNFHCKTPPVAALTNQAEAEAEAEANASTQSPPTLTTCDDHIKQEGWTEFSQKVSGEWDGFGADFTAEGTPIELPENVVPEAFREWDVKVFDWQTQCPTLAQQPNHQFMYKTIKLLPTVGCEADAATTHSIHERHATAARALAYHQSTASYVALWPPANDDTDDQFMELEHCLVHPDDDDDHDTCRYRVRVIQVLGKLKLRAVRVFVEQWYGPFRNGDQLGGCAIRDSAFATTRPLEESQISGVWQGQSTIATFSHLPLSPNQDHHHMIQPLEERFTTKTMRDGNGVVLLPKQLWCAVKTADNTETCCEAGWLVGPGRAVTSKCTFSSTGELTEIAIATETAIAEQ